MLIARLLVWIAVSIGIGIGICISSPRKTDLFVSAPRHQAVTGITDTTPRTSTDDTLLTDNIVTSSGTVSGHLAPGAPLVAEFLGIPYARPPVGSLRFALPETLHGKGMIRADQFGPACIQPVPQGPSLEAKQRLDIPKSAAAVLGSLGAVGHMSEDCLTLNIWAQIKGKKPQRPVLVWVHGGSFVQGSSAVPAYNGKLLADQEDVIVVTVNYRLNIFGFPGNPDTPPNLGLADVRLALEWVEANIAAFGGDPNRITLMGQSAGAALVDYYSYGWTGPSPIATGFVILSGSARSFGSPTKASATSRWAAAAMAVGCPAGASAPLLTACMRNASVSDLVSTVHASDTGFDPAAGGLKYNPVIDDKYVFSSYDGRQTAPGGYVIGNADNEAGFFRAFSAKLPETVWRGLNLRGFTCPAADRARRAMISGQPTWRLRYFGDFPNMVLTQTPPSRAWHTHDVPHYFDTVPREAGKTTDAQDRLGRYMRSLIGAFARDWRYGLAQKLDLPRYSPEDATLIRLGHDTNVSGVSLARGSSHDAECVVAGGGVKLVESGKWDA